MLEQRKTAHGQSNGNIRVRFYIIYIYVYQYNILLKCAYSQRRVSFIGITHRIVYTTACYPLSLIIYNIVCFSVPFYSRCPPPPFSSSALLVSLFVALTLFALHSFHSACVLPAFMYINKILSIFVRHFLIKFDDLLYLILALWMRRGREKTSD